MDKLLIEGQIPLSGEVSVSGAKNSVLPIMAATLLTDEPCVITNAPRLADTLTMKKLLESLGKAVDFSYDTIRVSSNGRPSYTADYKLVSTMRGSFCVLGPLVGKFRKAKVSLPGGCIIGVRPVDLHIKGLEALGAKVKTEEGYVIVDAGKLRGNNIYLGGVFGSSVLATENVMMAAVLGKGKTVIDFAACEPEVYDLGEFLIKMGAKIKGHGTPTIEIEGVRRLCGCKHKVIADRIEAGTWIIAALITGGNILVKNAEMKYMRALADILRNSGAVIKEDTSGIRVNALKTKLAPVNVATNPYPGFPTDMQAQLMALFSVVDGVSIITDKVFPDRFMHIPELDRMGAKIQRQENHAIIEGVDALSGADVMASDLRASAALVLAGLVAKGKTCIHRIYHLDRGYENLDKKLTVLGAKVWREKE